ADAIGRRAMTAALSDLAAMGARPLGVVVALAAPPRLPLARVDGLVRGLAAVARRCGAPLVGGNLTRARVTSLALTAVGAVRARRALRRDAARPGDRVLVTGTLGGAALAVARAARGAVARPVRRAGPPRLAAGRALRSEEHTSELQSRENPVRRLLLEKKNSHHVACQVEAFWSVLH